MRPAVCVVSVDVICATSSKLSHLQILTMCGKYRQSVKELELKLLAATQQCIER